MMEIYLDETGDNGLNFEPNKSQPWFLLTAILVDPDNRDNLISILNDLANKYFGGGVIKSKRLPDLRERQEFLEALPKNGWRGVILQVNKTLLDPDEFKWKQVFYKRVPRQLYNYLISALDDVIIFPDPIGDAKFQNSLRDYFVAKAPLNLFSESRLQFSSSKGCRINQLADFCSGTKFRDLRDNTDLFKSVRDRFSIRIWPISFRDLSLDEVYLTNDIDKRLFHASINLAKTFIEKHEMSEEPLVKDQTLLANLLVDEMLNGNPFKYSSSRFLRNELSLKKGQIIGEYYFRTKVIGKLRTNDVLIVSNRRGGYKLPVNYSEVEEYFKNMAEKVEPMAFKATQVATHVHTIMGKQLFEDPRWNCLNVKGYN